MSRSINCHLLAHVDCAESTCSCECHYPKTEPMKLYPVSWNQSVEIKCLICHGRWQGPFGSSCPHCEKAATAKPSILSEAQAIITGPRRESYGPVEESFERAARVWNELLFKKLKEPLVGTDVGMAMAGLKLCREANKHDRENLVDVAGYAALLDQLHSANPTQEPSNG